MVKEEIKGIRVNGFTLIPDTTDEDSGIYLWFNPGWMDLDDAKALSKALQDMVNEMENN